MPGSVSVVNLMEDYHGKQFFDTFQRVCEQYSLRTAVQWYDDDQKIVIAKTYAEFRKDVLGFAGALQQRFGGADGKHIGVYAKNSYAYIVCVFGIFCSRNVAVLLNYNEGLEQTCGVLSMADVDIVLADEDYLEKLRGICEPMAIGIADLAESVQTTAEYHPASDCDTDKPALLVFTSGTSGKNKCVMLTTGNLFATCREAKADIAAANECLTSPMLGNLVLLPIFHVLAFTQILVSLDDGDRLDLCLSVQNMYRDMAVLKSQHARQLYESLGAVYIGRASEVSDYLTIPVEMISEESLHRDSNSSVTDR